MFAKGPKISSSYRAAILLLRNMYPGRHLCPCKDVITRTGLRFQIYEPHHEAMNTVIMIYGLTLLGEADPRMTRFANSFRNSGFRVIVPVLPGLKSLDLCLEDLAVIKQLAIYLNRKYKKAIGLIAFSAGGGLALTACTDESMIDIVDPILLFGPYYHLGAFWERVIELVDNQPEKPDELDHWIWMRMALLYRHFPNIDLNQDEKDNFLNLLTNYCWESFQDKIDFNNRVLKDIDIRQFFPSIDPKFMDNLSPRGKINKLKSRVMLIHDQDDYAVPPVNSELIHNELSGRNITYHQKILITRLLSHVTPRTNKDISDIPKILSMIGEMYL